MAIHVTYKWNMYFTLQGGIYIGRTRGVGSPCHVVIFPKRVVDLSLPSPSQVGTGGWCTWE